LRRGLDVLAASLHLIDDEIDAGAAQSRAFEARFFKADPGSLHALASATETELERRFASLI